MSVLQALLLIRVLFGNEYLIAKAKSIAIIYFSYAEDNCYKVSTVNKYKLLLERREDELPIFNMILIR